MVNDLSHSHEVYVCGLELEGGLRVVRRGCPVEGSHGAGGGESRSLPRWQVHALWPPCLAPPSSISGLAQVTCFCFGCSGPWAGTFPTQLFWPQAIDALT